MKTAQLIILYVYALVISGLLYSTDVIVKTETFEEKPFLYGLLIAVLPTALLTYIFMPKVPGKKFALPKGVEGVQYLFALGIAILWWVIAVKGAGIHG